jgi:hypothetical protein
VKLETLGKKQNGIGVTPIIKKNSQKRCFKEMIQ